MQASGPSSVVGIDVAVQVAGELEATVRRRGRHPNLVTQGNAVGR